MPIKMLKFSFNVDVPTLTHILAAGHHEMNIEVVEDAPKQIDVPQVNGKAAPLALPKPRGNGRPGLQDCILKALRKHGKMATHELGVVIVAAGYSRKSLGGQLFTLRHDRLIKRAGAGHYTIAKKGMA